MDKRYKKKYQKKRRYKWFQHTVHTKILQCHLLMWQAQVLIQRPFSHIGLAESIKSENTC